jgi:hypothetical protein
MSTQELRFEAMTVGSLLDRAFRLYGSNFALLSGIVAVSYVPLFVVQISLHAVAMRSGGPSAVILLALTNLVVLLLSALVAYPLSEGAALFAISERYLGREVTIGEAYRRARQRWRTTFNAQLSVGLRVLLGLILLVVPGLIWMCAYAVTVPVVIVEGKTAAASMRRSWELTAGLRGKVFGVLFLVGMATIVLALGATSLLGLAGLGDSVSGVLVQEVITDLIQLAATPLGVIAPILLYYDARIRKEGFDLEMLGQALGQADARAAVDVG